MEWDKVKFESFRPSYEKYFDTYLNDKSITEYVSFSKWDSSLIFYKDDFAGFYKTITPDEEKNEKEIYIALIPKYRKKGMASYVVNTLTNNIFTASPDCEYVHLSIDKENISSINLASNCGFIENSSLEQELRETGDNRTLVFSRKNPFYVKEYQINHLSK